MLGLRVDHLTGRLRRRLGIKILSLWKSPMPSLWKMEHLMLHRFQAERLRELRKRAFLSQLDVERLTGIGQATISRIESGVNRPQCSTLHRLLNIYAIHISKLERLETAWSSPGPAQSQKGVVRIHPARTQARV